MRISARNTSHDCRAVGPLNDTTITHRIQSLVPTSLGSFEAGPNDAWIIPLPAGHVHGETLYSAQE